MATPSKPTTTPRPPSHQPEIDDDEDDFGKKPDDSKTISNPNVPPMPSQPASPPTNPEDPDEDSYPDNVKEERAAGKKAVESSKKRFDAEQKLGRATVEQKRKGLEDAAKTLADTKLRLATQGTSDPDTKDRYLALGGDASRGSPVDEQALPIGDLGLTTTTGAPTTPIDPTTAAVPGPGVGATAPPVATVGSGSRNTPEKRWAPPPKPEAAHGRPMPTPGGSGANAGSSGASNGPKTPTPPPPTSTPS